jgi:iron complex transport system permease protein
VNDTAERLGVSANRRAALWTGGLSLALLASTILCIGLGPVTIAPGTVGAVVAEVMGLRAEGPWTTSEYSILREMRIPRVILGIGVGAGLAVCGASLQAMVRNTLADPYILGVSGGASTGAAAALLFGFAAGAGQYALPLSAFLGALGASLLVFFLAYAQGRITSIRLLLAGIAIGYALSAVTSFMMFAADSAEDSRSVMFWLLGSLSLARWDGFLALTVAVVVATVLALTALAPRLDALTAGDETAQALGVRPGTTRVQLLVLVSLCTGTVVAAAGAIGFVGLVVPHIGRRLVGAAHARLIPVTALLGAILLIWADAGARVLMQPRELPLGIITALIGAPFLLILIRRMYPR